MAVAGGVCALLDPHRSPTAASDHPPSSRTAHSRGTRTELARGFNRRDAVEFFDAGLTQQPERLLPRSSGKGLEVATPEQDGTRRQRIQQMRPAISRSIKKAPTIIIAKLRQQSRPEPKSTAPPACFPVSDQIRLGLAIWFTEASTAACRKKSRA